MSLTTAIEKETKRKKDKEKEEIYRSWSYDGQRTTPPLSLYPISPFFKKKQKTKRYLFLTLMYSSLYVFGLNIFSF